MSVQYPNTYGGTRLRARGVGRARGFGTFRQFLLVTTGWGQARVDSSHLVFLGFHCRSRSARGRRAAVSTAPQEAVRIPEPGGAESEPRTPLSLRCEALMSRGGVRREKCGEVLGRRGRNLVAQYPLDHILVYRCDQNLPYKFSDA